MIVNDFKVGGPVQADFKGKKVLVVGLARSGVAAARALLRLGAEVTVTDKKPLSQLQPQIDMLGKGATIVAGGHPERIFLETDIIVLSPGVPKLPQTAAAKQKGVKVISELELGWLLSDSKFIAITGTNGKSTVTTLTGLMLEKAGRDVLVAGNIGNALTEEPARLKGKDWVVAEVSSFQLEDIETFRPRIASVLNVTQDHLDRYKDMQEYAEAKARIFMNQTAEDILVLNYDDPEVRGMGKSARSRVIPFSRLERHAHGVYAADGAIWFQGHRLCRIEDMKIKGVHNIENAMAAAAMAVSAGADKAAVEAVLREFPGLEHRLEFVRTKDGVTYINDSKGTNVGAVFKSLEGFDQPVILIAGGLDKGSDFSPLFELFRRKVKLLILIGKAAPKMHEALGRAAETVLAASLEEAVRLASEKAVSGDVVLLSPACASFDMFKDFEDRGRRFKQAVMGL